MPPSSALRSFTIVLAIVIAIVEPQASGYVINHNTPEETPPSDLATENSMQIQTKHSLRIENNVKGETGVNLNKSVKNNIPVDHKQNKTAKIRIKPDFDNKTTADLEINTESATTTENVRIPTISSDTIEVFDSTEDVIDDTQDKFTNARIGSDNFYTTQSEITTVNDVTTTDTTGTTYVDSLVTITSELPPYPVRNLTQEIVTESHVSPNTSMKQETVAMPQNTDNQNKSTATLDFNLSSISEASKEGATITDNEITTTDSFPDRENSTTVSDDVPTIVTTIDSVTKCEEKYASVPPEVDTTTISTTREINMTGQADITSPSVNITDKSTYETVTAPSKKIYTTIERKRSTSSEEMSNTMTTIYDSMRAETSNSHGNFEMAFTITPSLERLRVDLLSHTNTPIKNEQMLTDETAKATQSQEFKEFTITSLNTISDDTKKPAAVETKRGGFLNFSEKTTTAPMNAIVTIPTADVFTISEEPYLPGTGTASGGSEKPQDDKTLESHGQLTEDAIREDQLLKEETLSNQAVNVNRKGDEQRVQPLGGGMSGEAGASLSVQPINYERRTTLYTLSPNYKPMKKLEVQPAKPFVRDPDDNSWRNESISSLGIVFNPKNASKSFKEVLKNKTQIELSNLQEKDNKDNVPDLRLRLEKIAEVRKTKKKKTGKDGEVVYTDYEEGSAENSKETTTSTLQSSKLEMPVSTTPPLDMAVPTLSPDTPALTIANRGLHRPKNLGVGGLTTQKANKMFDIAEYYDTTDEYDADYVTLSKIDIKKQFAGSSRPPLTESRFPERRPTVQYFPPRTTQKVNFNNVDDNFERKVNLFDLQEMAPERATEAPTPPVATMTPEPPTAAPSPPAPAPTDPAEDFRRGAYIIRHYGDFLAAAGRAEGSETESYGREPAPHGREPEPYGREPAPRENDADYDYDARFRKDVLERFVDNFNQNSERFKVDFPVLYNSSVVHRREGGLASSRAFLRRVYGGGGGGGGGACVPPCGVTVELSPAYELHYYVPGQEEREAPPPPTD